MDLLGDWLTMAGVHGTVGAHIAAGGDWGVRWDGQGDAVIYAVIAGAAWIEPAGHTPVQLAAGDAYLVASGTPHALASDAGAMPRRCDTRHADRTPGTDVMQLGTAPPATHILAARYSYDTAITTQILALLPTTVHLRADFGAGCLGDTLRLLARELGTPRPAAGLVLDRLVDIMLVQFLRVWMEGAAQRPDRALASLLGAATDPIVGEAVGLIHAEPARPWTAQTLAAAVAVSRATLIRRFGEVMGTTPSAYLNQWRMDLASRRLRDTNDTIEAVAHHAGYTSVPAFSRAFTRAYSVAPARYRRSATE
ncbi:MULTISPECIES: AraC family transcriptional regulator [Nocardia]|uniref:AraC family transcriptional regulator n=1 Tax=Nocardia TaxID=1817 RepID=UPI0018963032|nr:MULTISPECIES: AraC family transcriptional regulator [Nocardia]MBF6352308.1 AraC family transcriptional regulator [Nocardia flavorosea]